jgi:hypothetical protein
MMEYLSEDCFYLILEKSAEDRESIKLTCASLCNLLKVNNRHLINKYLISNHHYTSLSRFLFGTKIRSVRLGEFTCNNAAQLGNLEILKYAHAEGFPLSPGVLYGAIEGGYLDCVKYILENSQLPRQYEINNAAEHGHLDVLKYLHENGYVWDENACVYAAANGNLECLKYLHENGCPWEETTCNYAVSHGNLECLKYAHENGCPCTSTTLYFAERGGYSDILEYLRGNNICADWRG